MILILVCLLVGLIGGFWLTRSFFETLFAALIGLVIGFVLAMFVGIFLPTTTVPQEPVYLHNLYDNEQINGRFFLGSGMIEGKEVVHYSYKEADGAIVFRSFPKEDIRVYEDNPETPYLRTYKTEYRYMWEYYIGVLPSDKVLNPEFHIPENSVDSNYHLK